ncbi:DeoR/GlpR family DNA-binding transcription regulator [Novosphingobium clariflavum]|uniref:DeoR/GlpR family DNA-binding transcription regulator n=1 Tax=Novosphingobium clariflavum TaxID=2029884 RepID=A0ABV6S7M1_9SPHN|nr:DeoR/GlpR family DNA-binding transcription regulator [Novosphingobium clariflavum]
MSNDPPLARRDQIAARLADGQSVSSATLAAEFGMSEDAIRRDLRLLAAQGLCRRVYGGALPLQIGSIPFDQRSGEDRDRKFALARRGAELIEPGEFVFLDNGSTNLLIVDALPDEIELTIATNSLAIASALARRPDIGLLMVGGAVDPLVGGCVDAGAVQAVAMMNIDRCFLGACSVSTEGGVSAFEIADATFKRALADSSQRVIVLATNEKLGTSAPHRILPTDRIDQLVIEHDAPDGPASELTAHGAALLRAAPAP